MLKLYYNMVWYNNNMVTFFCNIIFSENVSYTSRNVSTIEQGIWNNNNGNNGNIPLIHGSIRFQTKLLCN